MSEHDQSTYEYIRQGGNPRWGKRARSFRQVWLAWAIIGAICRMDRQNKKAVASENSSADNGQ